MKNIIIQYHVNNKIKSEKISIYLLKKKLSSCISILKNIKFIYIYKKKICKEIKYKIIITTTLNLKYKIINEIKKIDKNMNTFINNKIK